MDNKDFDKIFSEKLKETQDFQFMESDWDNVAGRIKPPEEEGRRISPWFWLLGLGFLIMTGTSLYLANSLKKTNQHLVDLKEAVQKQEINTLVVPDTVFKEVTITKTDTIYKSTVIEDPVRKSNVINSSDLKPKQQKSNIQSNPIATKSTKLFTRSEESNITSVQEKPSEPTVLNNNVPFVKATKNNSTSGQSLPLPTVSNNTFTLDALQLKKLSSSIFLDENLLDSKSKFQEPIIPVLSKSKKLSWDNLSVGVSGGAFMPRQQPFQSSETTERVTAESDQEFDDNLDLNGQIGFDVGLLLQYSLGKRFSLTGSAHYQQISYPVQRSLLQVLKENQSMDNSVDDLEVSSPTSGVPLELAELSDTLLNRYFEYKLQTLDYRLGANYRFRDNKKWRPFVGLSLAATSTLKEKIRESKDSFLDGGMFSGGGQNSGNLSFGETLDRYTSNEKSFRLNGVVPSAGFQLSLSKNISWQTEAWYHQSFNKQRDKLHGKYGLRTGIIYQF